MARTDKPEPKNTSQRRSKRKRESLEEKNHPSEDSGTSRRSSPHCSPDVPCFTIPEIPTITPVSYSPFRQRLSSVKLTIDAASDEAEEMKILQSPEYSSLVQWFIATCNFSQIDAEAFTYQLIEYHKITNLTTLYYLLLRDRNYLIKILPIGYLMILEQQLYKHFYKNLDEINSIELYHLFSNIGLSKNIIELLIWTYELNGFILATNYQLEQELMTLNISPLIVKSLIMKVQVWKTCGVPLKDLQPKNEGSIISPEIVSSIASDSTVALHNTEEGNVESKEDTGNSQKLKEEERGTNLDTSFEIALRECFQSNPTEEENSEGLKLNELFDFEIMSEFEEEVIDLNIDDNGYITYSKSSEDSEFVESNSSPNTVTKSDMLDEYDLSSVATRIKKKRGGSKFTVKEKAMRRKANSKELPSNQYEGINRNLSLLLMEVKGLKEPAIHFFESLLRKHKKEGLEEMIQRRVFPVLIEVIYDPNADESIRKKTFQIINTCVRAATNEQLPKFIHLDDSMVLINVSIKSNNSSLMHQSLIFLEQLILKQIHFLRNSQRIFMKLLSRGKEKIIKARMLRNLVPILEASLRFLPLDLDTLIEELPLIIFLFNSKDSSINYSLLQCCTMILEENKDDLTEYFLEHFPLELMYKFLSGEMFLLTREVLTICELIAAGKMEHGKKIVNEVKGLIPFLREVIQSPNQNQEVKELQALSYAIIGSICAGDAEDIELIKQAGIFPLLFLNIKRYAISLMKGSDGLVVGKKRSTKHHEEDVAMQCACALCYSLYGSNDSQISYLFSLDLTSILDTMLLVFHAVPEIMEELIPALNKLFTEDMEKEGEILRKLKAMVCEKHYTRIHQLKGLFTDKSKRKEIETLLLLLTQQS